MWDKYKFVIGLKDIWAVGLLVGIAGKRVMRHEKILNLFRDYVRLLYRQCSLIIFVGFSWRDCRLTFQVQENVT